MAFEQRLGGAEFGEDLVVGEHVRAALGRAASGFNTSLMTWPKVPLEAHKSRAYRGPQFRGRSRASSPTHVQG